MARTTKNTIKSGTTLALTALLVLAFAIPATALTSAQEARKAACEAIDPGPNVIATYTAGSGAAGANDTCVVVSTATTLEQSVEQVNNPRAAKAVSRVVQTEKTVTTTQEYRWDNRSTSAGGQKWVAEGDPLTAEEEAIIAECIKNPGGLHCA